MDKEFEFNEEENDFSNDELESPKEEEEITYEVGHVQVLNYPVKLTESNIVEELVYGNPLNGKMVAHLPGNVDLYKLGHMYPIIAGMTGQINQLVNKLEMSDLQEAMQIVSYFLQRGRETGEK